MQPYPPSNTADADADTDADTNTDTDTDTICCCCCSLQAAQLRVGAPQARVVAACRTAVKACDLTGLPRIMSLGAGGTGGD